MKTMCNWRFMYRRLLFRLLGFETMPSNVKDGDWVRHPGWSHGPVKIIDQNWALCAVAVQLGPNGGIVVWPMRKNIQVVDAPKGQHA